MKSKTKSGKYDITMINMLTGEEVIETIELDTTPYTTEEPVYIKRIKFNKE